MRLALLLVLAAGCATTPQTVEAPPPERVPGPFVTVVEVAGTVASVDTAPWAYDGNAVLVVATTGGEVRVEIPARTNLCAATNLGLVADLQPGDAVVVRGERSEAGVVTPCTSADHGLERG